MNLNLAALRSLGKPRWKVTATALPGASITRNERYLGKPILCWTRKRADEEQQRLAGLYTPGTVNIAVEQVGPVASTGLRQWIVLQLGALVGGIAAFWYSQTSPIHTMYQGPVLAMYGAAILASVLMEGLLATFGESPMDDASRIRLRVAVVWFAITDVMALIAAHIALVGAISVTITVFAIIAPATLAVCRFVKASRQMVTRLATCWIVVWLGVALGHMSVDATQWLGNAMTIAGIAGCAAVGLAILRPHWRTAWQVRARRPRTRS